MNGSVRDRRWLRAPPGPHLPRQGAQGVGGDQRRRRQMVSYAGAGNAPCLSTVSDSTWGINAEMSTRTDNALAACQDPFAGHLSPWG